MSREAKEESGGSISLGTLDRISEGVGVINGAKVYYERSKSYAVKHDLIVPADLDVATRFEPAKAAAMRTSRAVIKKEKKGPAKRPTEQVGLELVPIESLRDWEWRSKNMSHVASVLAARLLKVTGGPSTSLQLGDVVGSTALQYGSSVADPVRFSHIFTKDGIFWLPHGCPPHCQPCLHALGADLRTSQQRFAPAAAAPPFELMNATPEPPSPPPPSLLLQVRRQLCCLAHTSSCHPQLAEDATGCAIALHARRHLEYWHLPHTRSGGCYHLPTAMPELSNAVVVAGSVPTCCAPTRSVQVSSLLSPAASCAQALEFDPVNEAAVRAILDAHFERGEPIDYVQLKDVAAVQEARVVIRLVIRLVISVVIRRRVIRLVITTLVGL
ncbi:MAG: hypothetical protein SGPRY_009659 [Prymnesium sp.]